MKLYSGIEIDTNILLVTGNLKDAMLIKNLLRYAGYNFPFNHFTSLNDALKQASTLQDNIILLDLSLPDCKGLQSLSRIMIQYPEAPVVVLSNDDDNEILSSVLNDGAVDVLIKDKLNIDNVSHAIKFAAEWKKNRLFRQNYNHQLLVLSETTKDINECEDVPFIYKTVCENIARLHNGLMIVAFSIDRDETEVIRPVYTEGVEAFTAIIRKISGLSVFDIQIPLKEYSPDLVDFFLDGKIHELEGGISELSKGRYNKHLAKFIKKILNIEKTYGIGFYWNKRFYGGLLIFSKTEISQEEKSIIEAIGSQASLGIQQIKSEKEVRISERRYRSFFMDSPIPKWEKDYSEVKKEIDKLKVSGVKDLIKFFKSKPRKLTELISKIKITDFNPAVLEMYKARSREQLFDKLPLIISQEQKSVYIEEFVHIFNGHIKFDIEKQERMLNGEIKRLFLRWSVTEGYHKTLERVLVSAIDITEIRKAEDTLQKINEELEAKIKERTKDLNELNYRLENELTERRQIEEKLRESESLYRSIGELIDYGVWVCDTDGRNIYTSMSFLRLVGLSQRECSQNGFWGVMHPDEVEESRRAWEDCVKRGLGWDMEQCYKGVDGKWYYILSRGIPVKDENGKIKFWAGINLDISKLKKAEEGLRYSENRFKSLAENAPALICELDSQLRYTYINSYYFENLGYKHEDLEGKHVSVICHPEMKEEFSSQFGCQQDPAQCPRGSEWMFTDKEGNWRWFNCFFTTTVNTSGEQRLSVISFDITEKKIAEEQLKKFVSDLKYSNATKDKFFRIIAHDLKNPFSILLGASDILLSSADQYEAKSIKEFSKMINSAAKSGFALLENLLEWARAQTGSITFVPQEIKLSEIVNESVQSLQVYASNKKIKLGYNVPESLVALADKNMLNTILRNLVSNAIKFTNEEGEIFISAEADNGSLIIAVKDNGIGIDEENIEKLFRIDVKYSSQGTANESGTGLGLILCKEFVEKHGGRIWVNSHVGQGSEFKFTLPKFLN